MTTPTLFSDVAVNPFIAKSEPQGVIAEQATITVPSGTAQDTVIGMIRFQAGWTLTHLALTSADLGVVTLDVGYVLDGTTGENEIAYFDGIADNTDFVWPASASSLNVAELLVAPDDGYLSVSVKGGATSIEGDVKVLAQFTYDVKDIA